MDKKFVCPCGLTCCDCMFFKKEIYETAQKLRELIKINDLDFFLNMCSKRNNWEAIAKEKKLSGEKAWEKIGQCFDRFKDMSMFMDVLDGIIKLQCKTTCKEAGGCSIAGITNECDALKCVKSKGYNGCWECGEYINCNKLTFVKNNYGYVIEENLKTAKEKGIDAVESHGNKYYEWQRKKCVNIE